MGTVAEAISGLLAVGSHATPDDNASIVDQSTSIPLPDMSPQHTSIIQNTSDMPTSLLPEYYYIPYQVVATALFGLIWIEGVIGNSLVIAVVIFTKRMQTPTNCYLVSLAFSDLLVMVVGVTPNFIEHFTPIDSWSFGRVGCLLVVVLQNAGINGSALSITAFTVERYIAICHPMRAHTMCTAGRAKKIILTLWAINTVYCSAWFFLFDTARIAYADGTSIEICDYKEMDPAAYILIYMADFTLYYMAPMIMATVLYAMIARALYATTNVPRRSTRRRCDRTSVGNGGDKALKLKKSNAGISSRKQVIKMLIVVVLLFGVLWAPYRFYVIYIFLDPNPPATDNIWVVLFLRTMVYINCAINPILYNLMSMKFRKSFARLCRCRVSNKRSSTYRLTTMNSAVTEESNAT